MGEFLLTPVEVAEYAGSPQRRKQLEFFRNEGIPASVGIDGKVKVLRAAVEARMMPGQGRHKAKTEPNLALLKKAS